MLGVADPRRLFILQTDAFNSGLGAVLSRLGEDAVEYTSRTLLPKEVRYSVVEKESLAILWALQLFRVYTSVDRNSLNA